MSSFCGHRRFPPKQVPQPVQKRISCSLSRIVSTSWPLSPAPWAKRFHRRSEFPPLRELELRINTFFAAIQPPPFSATDELLQRLGIPRPRQRDCRCGDVDLGEILGGQDHFGGAEVLGQTV